MHKRPKKERHDPQAILRRLKTNIMSLESDIQEVATAAENLETVAEVLAEDIKSFEALVGEDFGEFNREKEYESLAGEVREDLEKLLSKILEVTDV